MVIRILTNRPRLSFLVENDSSYKDVTVKLLEKESQRFSNLFRQLMHADLIILDGEERLLYIICLLKILMPWMKTDLVSVDLILRKPRSSIKRIAAIIKGLMFRQVDGFILYHKEVAGYNQYYGVNPRKCIYIPFKINNIERILENMSEKDYAIENISEGEYVLTVGRSLRDIGTFVRAIEMANVPGMILRQEDRILKYHGTNYDFSHMPENIEECIDDGSFESFVKYLQKARVVVIPRFSWDINATGITVYLQAMALGKCVIISHGPGTTDLLNRKEAILVPPEDASALYQAIRKAWDDDAYRKKIAQNGHTYAMSLEGEDRLLRDVLRESLRLFQGRNRKVAALMHNKRE